MICPKCKAEIADKSRFCNECGSSISAVSAQSGSDALDDMKSIVAPSGAKSLNLSVGDLPTMPYDEAVSVPKDVNYIGTVVSGRYKIIEEIGQSNFALVFKGQDTKLNRTVTVKRLLSEDPLNAERIKQWCLEYPQIITLKHLNILEVYDHIREDGGDYIVMEHADGGTLKEYIKGRKLPVEEAIPLICGIASGLAYAHKKNIIHRELSPENILLSRQGRELIPKISDFGFALLVSAKVFADLGYDIGAYCYQSAEQRHDAKNVNHKADVYALGKIFYAMLTGDIMPDQVDPERIPEEWAKIVLKCVHSDPAQRYDSVDDVIIAIEAVPISKVPEQSAADEPFVCCPGCGSRNKPDAENCADCGESMEKGDVSPEENSKPEAFKSKKESDDAGMSLSKATAEFTRVNAKVLELEASIAGVRHVSTVGIILFWLICVPGCGAVGLIEYFGEGTFQVGRYLMMFGVVWCLYCTILWVNRNMHRQAKADELSEVVKERDRLSAIMDRHEAEARALRHDLKAAKKSRKRNDSSRANNI